MTITTNLNMRIAILAILLPLVQTAAATTNPIAKPKCIHYRGTMPFSDTLPFEATVVEESTTLCWMSTTYAEHNLMQILKNEYRSPEEKRKDDRGEGDYSTWGFRRWEMECLEGMTGWVNVGLRTVGIKDEREVKKGGRKRDTAWVTDVKEDVWGERWVFSKDVNCEKENKDREKEMAKVKAMAQEREKAKAKAKAIEEGKNKANDPERKKELAQELIRAAVGGQSSEKDEHEVKLVMA